MTRASGKRHSGEKHLSVLNNSAQFRHLTHLFTYPLTLAWIICYLDAAGYLVNTNNNDTLNIVCAGSRAEGQIPYLLWEECANIVGRKLHIHFVGPMQITHRDNEIKYKDILKLSYETGLYEPPPSLSRNNIGMTPDIFVAFNSGNSDKKLLARNLVTSKWSLDFYHCPIKPQ